MKNILVFCLLIIGILSIKGQLDRNHWFAPMVDGVGNPNTFQRLYLSTNRTTPFPVRIFNNTVQIATVFISKGNPQKYDIPRDLIITTLSSDLFTPISKGIYAEAEFPFYANLRFSMYNHAEIITSKGISAIGNNFYAAMAPISVSNNILNFMTSILATENNTTVSVSGYDPSVQFTNGNTGATTPTITFTLNKGQSYIIEGKGNITGNFDGFIGAKITSNKPISVTNGNFNGQYAGNHPLSSDILMDQSVPVNQLGNQFALVKGNGIIGNNMEGAMIIATENNTQVFLNNETTPAATLNDGEYFLVNENKFISQGNNHYNLYISTTKNAYVYQFLAGNEASSNTIATGGFNFIPALSCYLPKKIDELGLIDENEVYSNANPLGILNIPTKLNLITELGATVQINGAAPPSGTGPFPILGTPNWVTYGIPNVSGTITVQSSKAITAGINAGSDAVGYGGFFAGFATQPNIVSTGANCFPGITLGVDPPIYESYQWLLNGSPISGANSATFVPNTPGFYTASVTIGSCAPLVTAPFKVEKCMVNSTAVYSVCTSQVIQPGFSSPSIPQNIIPSSVSITASPTLGSVIISPVTGQITYTANNPGTPATDSFTYTFCGDDPNFPECETVVVTLQIAQISSNNAALSACSINGQANYNLANAVVSTQPNVSITYYPTLLDAQNENVATQILNYNNFISTSGTIIYAVVKSPEGCKNIAQITLNYFPQAVVSDFSNSYCDENFDGSIPIVLSNITPLVLQNPNYFTVNYYANLADANAGNSNTLPNNWSFSSNTTIFIRVISPDGCSPVIKPLTFLFGTPIPLLLNQYQTAVCDDDLDGVKSVNLASYISNFTNDPGVVYTFHSSFSDAQNNINPINSSVNVTTGLLVFIRFSKNGSCPNIGELAIQIKTPKKSEILQNLKICKNAKTILDAGPGFESYLWSDGSTNSTTILGAGIHWVDLVFNGCVYRQFIEITESELPVIESIEISNNNATIIVKGGEPPYEYSLDGFTWQSSNVFTDLTIGNYSVYVRDKRRCEIIEKYFSLIKLINAISPNDDGLNDAIGFPELIDKEDLLFEIYDRYGAKVFEGNRQNNFTWNGRITTNRGVNTSTYWYILQWKEKNSNTRVTYTSWLVVKNILGNYLD